MKTKTSAIPTTHECEYVLCDNVFTPTKHGQKYCGPRCKRKAQYWKTTRKTREKMLAGLVKWTANNPEKRKEAKYRGAAKSYRIGKLPRFMFS